MKYRVLSIFIMHWEEVRIDFLQYVFENEIIARKNRFMKAFFFYEPDVGKINALQDLPCKAFIITRGDIC